MDYLLCVRHCPGPGNQPNPRPVGAYILVGVAVLTAYFILAVSRVIKCMKLVAGAGSQQPRLMMVLCCRSSPDASGSLAPSLRGLLLPVAGVRRAAPIG